MSCLGYCWSHSIPVLEGRSIYYEQCADHRWRKIVGHASDVLESFCSLHCWPLALHIRVKGTRVPHSNIIALAISCYPRNLIIVQPSSCLCSD